MTNVRTVTRSTFYQRFALPQYSVSKVTFLIIFTSSQASEIVLRTFMPLVALLGFSPSAHADALKIVADYWAPYASNAGARPGYLIEIFQEAMNLSGHTVTYEVQPWSRCLEAVKKGEAQAAAGIYQEDAEAKGLTYEKTFPIGKSINRFFVRKGDTWKYSGPASFGAKTLGLIKGYSYEEIQESSETNKVTTDWATGEDALAVNLRKLAAKRIDIVVDDELVVKETAEKEKVWEKIQGAGKLGKANNVYIAFPPAAVNAKSPGYAKALAENVEKMRKSGSLAKILAKYGIKDWK